ncbi:hypothetical protein NECID01_0262 [Nematocida sp. AWRm77]|nr:hypothetical protein NECID01_0262 [Nematocida sp. AWRm77]
MEKKNNMPLCSVSLRGIPTSCTLHNGEVVVSHKSGEVVSFSSTPQKKTKLAKKSHAVTAVASVGGAILYGTKKGALEGIVNGQTVKLSNRHSSPVIGILSSENEQDIDVYTVTSSLSVSTWKLITDKENSTAMLMFVSSLHGPNSCITSGVLSPNGLFLACTAELSDTVHIFKLSKNTQLLFKIRPGEHALCVEWMSDTSFAVVSNTNTVYLFGMDSLAPLQKTKVKVPLGSACTALAKFTVDSVPFLALGCSTGDVLVFKYNEHAEQEDPSKEGKKPLSLHKKVSTGCSVVNGFVVVPETQSLFVILGKEEKNSRFIISPEGTNEAKFLSTSSLV